MPIAVREFETASARGFAILSLQYAGIGRYREFMTDELTAHCGNPDIKRSKRMNAPRLEAFKIFSEAPVLTPSTTDRVWMDRYPKRQAYRCLPMTIANAHCWELLVPAAFDIIWNGGAQASDLTIKPVEGWPAGLPLNLFVDSHFGRGIVTFHTGYIFRTPAGWNLLATGPVNEPRVGIYPYTGIVETDWLPYPFTMNWQMLDTGTVRFEQEEVFCTILPIPKSYLESWEVAIHNLADDPVLAAEHATFRKSRESYVAQFKADDPEVEGGRWQRHYFLGQHPDGTRVEDHTNKLRLAEPQDRSGTRPLYARQAAVSSNNDPHRR